MPVLAGQEISDPQSIQISSREILSSHQCTVIEVSCHFELTAKCITFRPGDILPTNKEFCPVGRPAGQATLLVKGMSPWSSTKLGRWGRTYIIYILMHWRNCPPNHSRDNRINRELTEFYADSSHSLVVQKTIQRSLLKKKSQIYEFV
jgi:hypothetical protein